MPFSYAVLGRGLEGSSRAVMPARVYECGRAAVWGHARTTANANLALRRGQSLAANPRTVLSGQPVCASRVPVRRAAGDGDDLRLLAHTSW